MHLPMILLPLSEAQIFFASYMGLLILFVCILFWTMLHHARMHEALHVLQREQRALLNQFHELIVDLDRAARAPSAPAQGHLQARVDDAIMRAPDTVDAQELSRLSGVSLNVARTVMAFHGKRRRAASRH